MTQLKDLKQNNENNESLEQYYRRTHDILRNLDDENKKKNDEMFSRLELIVLNQIIEKFVNELIDRQLRIKLSYKYMIEVSFETQSLYDVYLIAEEYSDRIASKKKTLKEEFEKKLSIVMQRQDIETVARFVMKNQSEAYTQKSKSISVDRIERYRSKQHKKFESTVLKNIVKKNSQSCENFVATTISADKLTQSYIDENSSNSNVSILSRISERSQSTSHSDSSISENMMTLSSQSESICDSISNDQLIRLEKSIEIYAYDSSK